MATYDPEVTQDDIRSMKRFFRSLQGVPSKIDAIRYIGPNDFKVVFQVDFFMISRDGSGWRIVDKGSRVT